MKKLATILLIAAFGTVALAHSGVKNEAVMKRMALMTSIAQQMKIVGTMAKGQATFDVLWPLRLRITFLIVSTIAVLLDPARMSEADAVLLMMMYGSLSALVGAYFGFSGGATQR